MRSCGSVEVTSGDLVGGGEKQGAFLLSKKEYMAITVRSSRGIYSPFGGAIKKDGRKIARENKCII